jgi:hypothetical protein
MSVATMLSTPGTLVQRSQTGPEDEYGSPTWETVSIPIMCNLQPKTSEELVSLSAGKGTWNGFFFEGAPIDHADALLAIGREFEFDGPSRPWNSPISNLALVAADLIEIRRVAAEESS